MLIARFWDTKAWTVDCVRTLNIWLLGYMILEALHAIRTIAIVFIWYNKPDPGMAQIKIEVFYGFWVFIAEAAWIVYGNTFIYTDEIKECHYITRTGMKA